MTDDLTVRDLWDAAPASGPAFRAGDLPDMPAPARRYLERAIAPGTPLARAVHLRMHGSIKLRGWHSFTAEQAIVWDRGFIWAASVRMFGLPIRGSDRLVDGQGTLRWKLLGLIPFITASGPDIARSAAGRLALEAVWLPSALCGDNVSWTGSETSHTHAGFTRFGEAVDLELGLDDTGRLTTINLSRWGNPDGGEFRYANFGGVVEAEGTFDGYTIPTGFRAGWYFGTDRFEPEGEFFRVSIDEATFK
jgi:hypothetical protein